MVNTIVDGRGMTSSHIFHTMAAKNDLKIDQVKTQLVRNIEQKLRIDSGSSRLEQTISTLETTFPFYNTLATDVKCIGEYNTNDCLRFSTHLSPPFLHMRRDTLGLFTDIAHITCANLMVRGTGLYDSDSIFDRKCVLFKRDIPLQDMKNCQLHLLTVLLFLL
jgi:hypothetical protein